LTHTVVLLFVYFCNISALLFLVPEIFVPDAHETEKQHQQSATENVLKLWHCFVERVSWF